MHAHKLMIAESTGELGRALTHALKEKFHIRCCTNGIEALSMLRSFRPDVLVLDLMLSHMDGITILHTARQENITPAVLAVTRLFNDYVEESLRKLNVDYVMMKPCSVPAAAAHILDLAMRNKDNNPEVQNLNAATADLLLSLSFSQKHQGFGYLIQGILYKVNRPDAAITKEIYPAVASMNNTTTATVEHCIRTAAAAAWNRRDEGIWLQYFPGNTAKPTNAALISRLADLIRRP